MTKNREPECGDSIKFWDAATNRECCYIYPCVTHSSAGWILFRHRDGQWVTWRKATPDDLERINKCVIAAYHAER